ncbi:putative inorganic phosphate cotransporter [Anthonomus grandis grandis]|uniref:putative inorganic phosphate cotransporter n=1 Tax=Anthonomus grandis grandis TaxID=2921223 RepID=UPI0021662C17|nr:putative inorganic phosphate cotransporter [Anthonomus grandis grandis]XP_050295452.1 putative inorganic phosphate cotransporter [Anthonomus grandis grandis]XP_050295453.1 putative inorganic phosphate cotransporter [Anthonomus grandis grandis]
MTAGKGGTVFAILVTGFIAASVYGWPWAFCLFGIIGIIWCICMVFFGYDVPAKDPRISLTERKYIEESTGIAEHHVETPWKKIIKSKHVWALFVAQTGNNYCFWTLLTQIPTYMNYVMNFDMKHNSILSALPYLTFWLLGFVFGPISDILINKGVVTRGGARKICNSIGLMVPAAALIALGFTSQDRQVQGVILLIIAVGFNAACFSGFAVNHMDLSPNHAGILMGLCNGCSQITGVLAPIIVQLFVPNLRDHLQWRNVFFLAASINVSTAVIFILFGSGEVQPWDIEDAEENKEDKKCQL